MEGYTNAEIASVRECKRGENLTQTGPNPRLYWKDRLGPIFEAVTEWRARHHEQRPLLQRHTRRTASTGTTRAWTTSRRPGGPANGRSSRTSSKALQGRSVRVLFEQALGWNWNCAGGAWRRPAHRGLSERAFPDEADLVAQVVCRGCRPPTHPRRPFRNCSPPPVKKPFQTSCRQSPVMRSSRNLGRGAMGIAYKARDMSLDGRLVALKMVRVGWGGPEERARAQAEASAQAKLNIPWSSMIHSVGEHNSLPFLSLEYVSGKSLKDRLQGSPLSLTDPCPIRVREAGPRAAMTSTATVWSTAT